MAVRNSFQRISSGDNGAKGSGARWTGRKIKPGQDGAIGTEEGRHMRTGRMLLKRIIASLNFAHSCEPARRWRIPQPQRPVFEPLEPRLLLSGTTLFSTPALDSYSIKPPALVMPLTAGTSQSNSPGSTVSVCASNSQQLGPNIVATLPAGSSADSSSLSNVGGTIAASQSTGAVEVATLPGTGGEGYGGNPDYYPNLYMDSAGNIYGTTYGGGDASNDGTVFEIVKGSTTATILATFNGTDGSHPSGSIVVDSSGDVFGATSSGSYAGYGAVFEVVHGSGTITDIGTLKHSNISSLIGGVVTNGQGELFGVSWYGGTNGYGAVYEVAQNASSSTSLTLLASFDSTTGVMPNGVAIDSSGNLYGTAYAQGANYSGTVWKLSKGSSTISVLASFDSSTGSPISGVTLGSSGNIFGTADGGASGAGVVYELVKGSNSVTTLASFSGGNGARPYGPVTLDGNGSIYGTAYTQASGGYGAAYELPAGASSISDLFTFPNGSGMSSPIGGVVIDASGDLFGTASTVGGTSGVVFDIPNATSLLSPPAVTLTTPTGKQQGDVTINYSLASAGSDTSSIVAQYSPDGGTTWETAAQGTGGDGMTGLTSSPTGTAHTFVWASGTPGTDLANISNSDIEFRIIPSSANGAGSPVATSPFTVDDVVPSSAVTTPGRTQSDNVTVTYTLTDAVSDTLNVDPEYSTDGGQTWHQATSAGGDGTTNLTSSPSGTSHTFVWASGTDLPGVDESVIFSMGVVEAPGNLGSYGTAGRTAAFTIDNGPLFSGVQFISAGSGSYSATINGSGFGSTPVSLGYFGDTFYLRIIETESSGTSEWGYTGDNQLVYKSWTNNQIIISGLYGQPGDAITVEVWNPQTGISSSTNVSLPLPPSIKSVTTHGVPGTNNWGFIIQGSNLGDLSSVDGTTADLNLIDRSRGFSSGYTSDTITANVVSWTNTTIEIANLGGAYGQSGDVIQALDQLKLLLINPQTQMISNTFDFTPSATMQTTGGYLGLQVSGSQPSNAAIVQNGNTVTFIPSGAAETQYVSAADVNKYLSAGDNVTLQTTGSQGIGSPDILVDSGLQYAPNLTVTGQPSSVVLSLQAAGDINVQSGINVGGAWISGNPGPQLSLEMMAGGSIAMTGMEISTGGGSVNAVASGDISLDGANIQTYQSTNLNAIGNVDLSAPLGEVLLGSAASGGFAEIDTYGGSLAIQAKAISAGAHGSCDLVTYGGAVTLSATSGMVLNQTSIGSYGNGGGASGGGIVIASGGDLVVGDNYYVHISSGGGTVLIADSSAAGSIAFAPSGAQDSIYTAAAGYASPGSSAGGGALEVCAAGTVTGFGSVQVSGASYSGGSAGSGPGWGGGVVVSSGGTVQAQGSFGVGGAPNGGTASLAIAVPGLASVNGGAPGQPGALYVHAATIEPSQQPAISSVAVTQDQLSPGESYWYFAISGENFSTTSTPSLGQITVQDVTRGLTLSDQNMGLETTSWQSSQITTGCNPASGVGLGDKLVVTVYQPQSGYPSAPFTFYASEAAMPSATVVTPTGTQSGTIAISYTLTDATSSNCNILAQYNTDGGMGSWWNCTPATGWAEEENLTSSPTGVAHTFQWDSFDDVNNINGAYSNDMVFRITPSTTGLTGAPADTQPFTVDNAASALPSAAITKPTGTQAGDVAISYMLTDASSETCSISANYSVNGGPWLPATPGSGGDGISGLTSSPGGTTHTFIWNSANDIAGVSSGDVQFRITPSATGGTGSPATTAPFTVNNSQSSTAVPSPDITNVSIQPLSGSSDNWTITITGSNFGTQSTPLTASPNLLILDKTNNVPAGNTGDSVTSNVTSWTDSQIIIQGFGGTYGQPGLTINPGDKISVTVTNPQTGEQGAFTVTVPSTAVPVISSISFQPNNGNWIMTVTGSGFGSYALFVSGTSPYLDISDSTTGLNAGHTGDWATVTVTSWTDNSIVVSGFGGSNYGVGLNVINPGDKISVTVWNPQTEAASAAFSTTTPQIAGTPPAGDTEVVVATSVDTSGNWTISFQGGGFSNSYTVNVSLLHGILNAVQTVQQIENLLGDVPGFHIQTDVEDNPTLSFSIEGDMYFSPTGNLDAASLKNGLSISGLGATVEGYFGLSFLNVGLYAGVSVSAGLNDNITLAGGEISMSGGGYASGTLQGGAEGTLALWEGKAYIQGTLGANFALSSSGYVSAALSVGGQVGLEVDSIPLFGGEGTPIWTTSYSLGSYTLGQWSFNIGPTVQDILNAAASDFKSFLAQTSQAANSSLPIADMAAGLPPLASNTTGGSQFLAVSGSNGATAGSTSSGNDSSGESAAISRLESGSQAGDGSLIGANSLAIVGGNSGNGVEETASTISYDRTLPNSPYALEVDLLPNILKSPLEPRLL